MKVAMITLALLAMTFSASWAMDCQDVCKSECALANQACMIAPADELCQAAKNVCDGICEKACSCLGGCTKNCPTPATAAGLVPNAIQQGTLLVCRISCRAQCGLSVGTEGTSAAINTLMGLISQLTGIGAAPTTPAA